MCKTEYLFVDTTKIVHSEEASVAEVEIMAVRIRVGDIKDCWGRHEELGPMVIIRPWGFPWRWVENCCKDMSRRVT